MSTPLKDNVSRPRHCGSLSTPTITFTKHTRSCRRDPQSAYRSRSPIPRSRANAISSDFVAQRLYTEELLTPALAATLGTEKFWTPFCETSQATASAIAVKTRALRPPFREVGRPTSFGLLFRCASSSKVLVARRTNVHA